MIENMRKYTGLMVVILVLLAAGLILTMGNFDANTGARAKETEVYGKGIDQIEYRKLGQNSVSVINQLCRERIFYTELASYVVELITNKDGRRITTFGFTNINFSPEDIKKFVTRRIVVAKTAAEYGIYPSTEQAKKHIKEKIFAQEGNFDPEAYQEFIKNIGSSGLQEDEFVNLVAESLVYARLKNLISSGLQEPNALTDRAIKLQQQVMDITTVSIDIEKYKKEITPTDEEVQTYWKENDFKYLTDREISISYIVMKPVYSSPRPIAPVRAPEAKDEEFKLLDTAYQATLAKWELEVEKPADQLVAGAIDDLAYKVDDSEGKRFDEEAKNAKIEVTATKLFSQKNVPEELKLLNSKDGQSIADFIFNIKISDSLKFRIPAPVKLEGNGYFYVRYDKEVMPKTKTYEQAKEFAKADYIQLKANAAMLEDVKNIKEKLAKSIADGTSAEDAAKINNLKAEFRTGVNYANLGKDETGEVKPTEYAIFENGTITDPSSFSEKNVEEQNQVILVYLHKREVENTTEVRDTRLRIQKAHSANLQESVFSAWMDDAVTKANIPAKDSN